MSPSLAALRLQCTPRQTGYGGRSRTYVNEFQKLAPFQLGHSVRVFELVDLARFERATSTFAESRSDSAELQVRDSSGGERAALTATSAVARSHPETLAEAAGVEPAHAMRGDLANRCHTIRRRLRKDMPHPLPPVVLTIWRKVKESNPRDALLGLVFKTSCAPPRATFQIWLGRPDLNRESRVWNPMVCR